MQDKYNADEGEKYAYDENELILTKMASLLSMINNDEVVTNITFMCKVAESRPLMTLLMKLLETESAIDACHALLYYNPKSLTSKKIRHDFVLAMKKYAKDP